ncbi:MULTISPECIES: glycoside hydrolase family 19 protein [Pseudomonas]|uniref:glycoside hydrolase family 19 protein n=1 Tax=Pseudomonas TaxID=286 RepID=UPI000DA91338|nr:MULTISPECIES: glycoside hydrolase family 19 protein [Pseudomonas]MDW3710703.1 glycoside hydrolase family 19 protein [Pseudomonas sp. 2023EL-01195]PZE12541.1 glycoside hydrolase family 19 protein [Pseudomonas sp. 57B-090624]
MSKIENLLLLIFPNARPEAGVFISALTPAMSRFSITTPARQSAFLAQCAHESAGFSRLAENLNYSASGLAATWPGRFRGVDGQPNALALAYQRRPAVIANHVYANRMGNGDEESGDGWRFRGRGLLQITGRGMYQRCGDALGLPLLEQPDLLLQPEPAVLSAAWFWQSNGLNALADAGDFEAITRRINGGLNGLAERKALWLKAREALE